MFHPEYFIYGLKDSEASEILNKYNDEIKLYTAPPNSYLPQTYLIEIVGGKKIVMKGEELNNMSSLVKLLEDQNKIYKKQDEKIPFNQVELKRWPEISKVVEECSAFDRFLHYQIAVDLKLTNLADRLKGIFTNYIDPNNDAFKKYDVGSYHYSAVAQAEAIYNMISASEVMTGFEFCEDLWKPIKRDNYINIAYDVLSLSKLSELINVIKVAYVNYTYKPHMMKVFKFMVCLLSSQKNYISPLSS